MADVAPPVKRLSRQERQQQTRLAILDAAIQLFIERGIDATSIEEVVAAAGFTRGAFYSNFESKDELFLEASRHFFDDVLFSGSTGLEGGDAYEDGRASYVRVRSVVDNHPSIYLAEASLYAFRHPALRDEFAAMHEAQLQHTIAWVEAAMATYGIDKPAMPSRTLANITQAVTFGLHLKELLDPTVNAADALAGLLALLMRPPPPAVPKPRRAKK